MKKVRKKDEESAKKGEEGKKTKESIISKCKI